METILYTGIAALLAITLGPLAWGFVRGLNGFVENSGVLAGQAQEFGLPGGAQGAYSPLESGWVVNPDPNYLD